MYGGDPYEIMRGMSNDMIRLSQEFSLDKYVQVNHEEKIILYVNEDIFLETASIIPFYDFSFKWKNEYESEEYLVYFCDTQTKERELTGILKYTDSFKEGLANRPKEVTLEDYLRHCSVGYDVEFNPVEFCKFYDPLTDTID